MYREPCVPVKGKEHKPWLVWGVNLGRATMANWILVASRNWLVPLVELMHQKLLKEKYLHAETVAILLYQNTFVRQPDVRWCERTGVSHPLLLDYFLSVCLIGKTDIIIPNKIAGPMIRKILKVFHSVMEFQLINKFTPINKRVEKKLRLSLKLWSCQILICVYSFQPRLLYFSQIRQISPIFYIHNRLLLLYHLIKYQLISI